MRIESLFSVGRHFTRYITARGEMPLARSACEHAGLLGGDAQLEIDEEFDGSFVDLADEDGAVEAADGDVLGVEGFLHGGGAFANEREKAFALTFGRFDGEGDVVDVKIGEGRKLEFVDEFAERGGGRKGIADRAVESVENPGAAAEEWRAAVAGRDAAERAEAGFARAGAGVEAERAVVELEARRFGGGGFEELEGGANVFGLAGGIFFTARNGNGGAHVVGGLHEGDGRGALSLKRDGDHAGDGRCCESRKAEGERREGGGEKVTEFHEREKGWAEGGDVDGECDGGHGPGFRLSHEQRCRNQ